MSIQHKFREWPVSATVTGRAESVSWQHGSSCCCQAVYRSLSEVGTVWHAMLTRSDSSAAGQTSHLPVTHLTPAEAGRACGAVPNPGVLLTTGLTCPGRTEGPAEAGDVCNAVLVGRQVLVPHLEVVLHDAIQPAAQHAVSAQAQLQQGSPARLVTTDPKLLCASAGSCAGPAQWWQRQTGPQDRKLPTTHVRLRTQNKRHSMWYTRHQWGTSSNWLGYTAVVLAKPCLSQESPIGCLTSWSHFWYLLIPYSIFSGAYLQQRQL